MQSTTGFLGGLKAAVAENGQARVVAELARAQAEIAKQQRHLDDPNLFGKDRKKFDRVSAALADAQKQLQDAEDKWLELEMLREEIENA